jgi:two-component system, sensor histidine kinase and response regulator
MKTILVIEDDPLIREAIQDVLELEGYRTLAAADGAIGVQQAIETLPDLILCDIAMPEMDGYAVLQQVRHHALTRAIPFVFLTARTNKADQRYGMNLGADDYITKPCTAEDLLGAITSQFKKQSTIKKQMEERLNNLRSNIALSLPHEFYTPLNGILGFSELLVQDYATLDRSEIHEIAEAVHVSALRLHHLIQNFLLYSKLELLTHHPEQLQTLQSQVVPNPEAVIQTVVTQAATQTHRSADLRCEFRAEPAAVLQLALPEAYLRKLVAEVTDNAFKFSEPNTPVEVKTELRANQMVLLISNYGRGMTAAQIASLGAYMQFDRQAYEQQGFGLGLTIVKRIAELFQGQLNIQSTPGRVTTVQITLPLVLA